MAKKYLLELIEKYCTKFILISSIVLSFVQIYISYNIYFFTGWDAGSIITPAAKTIASGMPVDGFNGYFSANPNNITLVWIFLVILKINEKFGILDTSNGLMSIITVNCFVSSMSGFLTYKCVEKLVNKKWASVSWIVYFLLIGTSPWVVITYSDPFALFLPILIFFVYTRDLTGKANLIKWFLIGVLSFIGYHIKPQVIIIFIGIAIVEIWRLLILTNVEKKKKLLILVAIMFSFFYQMFFVKIYINRLGLI
jgi:hypothetical protein